jgi:hypothetical protein
MSTSTIENKHFYDATYIRAAIRQIDNPEAPVVDNLKEWLVAFAQRPRKRNNAT